MLPVFDGNFERLGKGDGIFDVPAVGGESIAGHVAFPERYAVIRAGECAESPGVAEVVFGASTSEGGFGFTVDVEAVIAFAEPANFHLLTGVYGSDVMSGAFGFEQGVVSGFSGHVLAVFGME